MNNSNKIRFFKIFLLILAGGVIYPVLYLRQNYQTSITLIFNMTVEELNFLYFILGIINVVFYAPSGILADKFSAKKLVSFSLFTTGILSILFAQIPDKKYLIFIYLGWGISVVLTFWGALMKGIKLLAKKEEQARIFGFLEGGMGIVEGIFATIGVTIFAYIMGDSQNDIAITKKAMQFIIYMYAFLCIIVSILIFIFLDKDEINNENNTVQKQSGMLSDLKKLFLIKEYWLAIVILFCGYTVYWTIAYFSGFLTINHNVTAVMAGYISVAMLWTRPIGGIGGGILGDKLGKTTTIAVTIILGSIILLFISFMTNLPIIIYFIAVIVMGLIAFALRGLYWSTLDYCEIPDHILGRAIGIMSVLGYSVDIFMPYVSGKIFSYYKDGPLAYTTYFTLSAIIGIIGFIAVIMLHLRLKKYNKL